MNSSNPTGQLLSKLLDAQKAGQPVVLATVVKARGSVPRHPGAKMLIYGDGRFSGTIGGGEMESRVVKEAMVALLDGRPRILPYSLVDPGRGDPGVCGGEVEIYIEPYGSPSWHYSLPFTRLDGSTRIQSPRSSFWQPGLLAS